MDWVLLIGRILFVSLFVTSGVMFHLGQRRMAVDYARSEGAPLPELSVPLTGLIAAGAGALTVLGIWVDLAALVFAVLALGFAYWMHAYWKVEDPMMRINQQNHFWKNVQIAGGALVLFYLFQQFGEDIGLVIGPAALFD